MNMTSTRLAHTSISFLTCNVSINLVNTKGKNFSDLDMQAATSSTSLVYLRSCLFPFLLMVSPIYRCTRKIRYTSNSRLRERRWVDSRTFSFFSRYTMHMYSRENVSIIEYFFSCFTLR